MKKVTIMIAAAAFIGGVFFISSCKKDDTGNPVVTLKGNNPDRIAQYSAATYSDPGATATDDTDGNLTPTVSGSVNMNSAGEYTLTYTATDGAGNKTDAVRTVVVDGGMFLAGNYTTEDFTGSTSNGTYPEVISSSSTVNNKINFTKFAFYANGTVYATVSGTAITIPNQTVHCGTAPNDADRTFTGNGTFTNNFTTFTINYTEVTGGTPVTGHGVYTRN